MKNGRIVVSPTLRDIFDIIVSIVSFFNSFPLSSYLEPYLPEALTCWGSSNHKKLIQGKLDVSSGEVNLNKPKIASFSIHLINNNREL